MLTSVKGHYNIEIMFFCFIFECNAFQTGVLTSVASAKVVL